VTFQFLQDDTKGVPGTNRQGRKEMESREMGDEDWVLQTCRIYKRENQRELNHSVRYILQYFEKLDSLLRELIVRKKGPQSNKIKQIRKHKHRRYTI
jgi:hypothetical protein